MGIRNIKHLMNHSPDVVHDNRLLLIRLCQILIVGAVLVLIVAAW